MDSMHQEIWKPIQGYEGNYEVSNQGRVRSIDRTKKQFSKWGKLVGRRLSGKILSPLDNGKGYLVVGLRCGEGYRKNCYIHRLVATAFIEHPPGRDYVNHKDFNTKNNASSNLEWVTQRQNILYSAHHMRKPRQSTSRSKTGEKYIYTRGNYFRLMIPGHKERSFKTFDEALHAKGLVIDGR